MMFDVGLAGVSVSIEEVGDKDKNGMKSEEEVGEVAFRFLVLIGAFDAAAELVIFFLKRTQFIEILEHDPPPNERMTGIGNYWEDNRVLGTSACCGGDSNMFLELLDEFESAESPEAFKSHIMFLLEKWTHRHDVSENSGTWWTKRDQP